MNFSSRNLRLAAQAWALALLSLGISITGFVIGAGSAEAALEAVLRPEREALFYLLWGLAGMNAGGMGVVGILHYGREENRSSRIMDHPAFVLGPASMLLLAGALGFAAGRAGA